MLYVDAQMHDTANTLGRMGWNILSVGQTSITMTDRHRNGTYVATIRDGFIKIEKAEMADLVNDTIARLAATQIRLWIRKEMTE